VSVFLHPVDQLQNARQLCGNFRKPALHLLEGDAGFFQAGSKRPVATLAR